MNADKNEIIRFGAGNGTPNDNPNNWLKQNDSCKYLRIHLEKILSFRHHINQVRKKLSRFC